MGKGGVCKYCWRLLWYYTGAHQAYCRTCKEFKAKRIACCRGYFGLAAKTPRLKVTQRMNKVLSEHIEWLGKKIVDIAFQIHKTLGPGLLEKVYEACFAYELTKRGISFITQKKVP